MIYTHPRSEHSQIPFLFSLLLRSPITHTPAHLPAPIHTRRQLESLVTDNSTAEGCAATIKAFPNVDVLVNNLGIYEAVGFFEETDESWQRLFDTNIMR